MKEDLFRKLKMQSNLRKAIERDLLEVYYQPKIGLKYEKLIGIEAFLRWKYRELGTVSPSEFIPIAEETGIIIELERYVIRKVCKQIIIWEANRVNYINVSVNVSAKQFRDTSLPEYMIEKERKCYKKL